MSDKDSGDDGACPGHALSSPQSAAARSPGLTIREIVAEVEKAAGAPSTGNFHDLDTLLEQFSTAPIIELGKPLPKQKHLPRRPRRRVGRCPAAHNRALVGKATG